MQRNIFTTVAFATLICSLAAIAQPDTVWTRIDARPGGIKKVLPYDGGVLCFTELQTTIGDTIFITQPYAALLSIEGDTLWCRRILDFVENAQITKVLQRESGFALLLAGFSPPDDYNQWIALLDEDLEVEQAIGLPTSSAWDDFAFDRLGGVVVVGETSNGIQSDGRFIGFDSSGDLGLDVLLADTTLHDHPSAIAVENDGGIVIVGYQAPVDNMMAWDAVASKFSTDGELLWTRVENSQWPHDIFHSVYAVEGGGSLIVGNTDGAWTGRGWMMRVNASGDVLWTSPQDSLFSEIWILDVFPALSGGYFVCGVADAINEPWVAKLDADGLVLMQHCCWGYNMHDQIHCGVEFAEGNLFLGGRSWQGSVATSYLVRFSMDASSATEMRMPIDYRLHPNHPNPFNATTEISFDLPRAAKVSLRVYDVLGREAAQLVNGTLNAGTHSVNFDAAALASGVYFYRIETENFVATRKMVLLK